MLFMDVSGRDKLQLAVFVIKHLVALFPFTHYMAGHRWLLGQCFD